ncbi:MAG: AmmeMemoRadiSam system protein B [Sulfurimonas sp.]
MSVAGSFYPDDKHEILKYINYFNEIYAKESVLPDINTKVVIVPHAGYVYSGYTANIAYRLLQKSGVKKYLVIGPSHRVGFDGISMSDENKYATPFGEIQNAQEMRKELAENFSLRRLIPHEEHSTEVQFPFLKHYIPDVEIIELIYGRVSADEIAQIIDFVLEREEWGVVVSSDLSHFHNLETANSLDILCAKAIINLDLKELNSGCEACGILGIEALIKSAIKFNMHSMILDYKTSADATKDDKRVVGYLSACFTKA